MSRRRAKGPTAAQRDAAPFAVRSQHALVGCGSASDRSGASLALATIAPVACATTPPMTESQIRDGGKGTSLVALLAFAGLAGPPQVAGAVWRRKSWLKGISKELRHPVSSPARAARKRSPTNQGARVEGSRLFAACRDPRRACRSDRSVSGE